MTSDPNETKTVATVSGAFGLNATAANVDAQLQLASQAQGRGNALEATAILNRILAEDADNVEALHQLGLMALNRDAPGEAVRLLNRAAALDRGNALIMKNLGLAYVAVQRPDEARFVFERALDLDPGSFIARLHLAGVMELLGHKHQALTHYFGAVTQAQAKGRWLNDQTTAPHLRDLVLHAMEIIDAGRRSLLVAALEPLRAEHGDAALQRVMQCVDIFLGTAPPNYPDARQQPKFLYFPDLPTIAFFERDLFPWYAELESNFAVIREELESVLRTEHGIEPFLKFDSADQAGAYLAGTTVAPPVWDAFFFYRHGVRNDENCARCHRTAAIIDALPIVRIREHAPEICFSVLTPGTHILPHRGVTNTRLVTHLPLIVPNDCAIEVGGERKVWIEGQCFTFDDTFEHEAWNRGNSTRVVMLMDCWNPYLTELERDAVTLLVGAISDFNREAGVASE
jgi:aspartate beta-hydroxylase